MRRAMREQKAALRKRMKQSRDAARAKLDAIPAVREARRKRRIRQGVGLVVLLLLALFFRCDCTPEPAVVVVAPTPDAGTPVVEKKPAVPVKVKQKPLTGKVDTQPRGKYENDSSATPSWLDEYRLQVAARSPRLAECFTGAERPGALRWSASVNAASGAVSDHGLEPVGPGPSVQDSQRECVLRVLSNPPYKLNVPKEEAEQQKLPRRISIVIEF
jgi:hypothetical protein